MPEVSIAQLQLTKNHDKYKLLIFNLQAFLNKYLCFTAAFWLTYLFSIVKTLA